jgi:hypothetical protein
LQDADPLRYEVRPSLEAARERFQSALAPVASSVPLVRNGRRRAALAYAAAALVLAWVGAWGLSVTTPVSAQVRFEVRLAEDRPAPGLLVAQVATSERLVYLHPEAVVDNDDIAHTWVIDGGTRRFGVGVQVNAEGAERLRRLSGGHSGRPVAILIDGTVVVAPVVRSAMSDSAVISGEFTREEAGRIAQGLERR